MASTTIPESWRNSPSDDVYTIKILRGDAFRGYEGFDLVDSYDESPSSKVLVFYVPKIESYGVFKEVVLRHIEMPTEDVRFWVCFNRQNGTIRPFEPVKREMVDSAPMTELVSCHGTSVRIKMYLEFADDKKPPLSTHSLVFLKHFDVQRQRIYGVKKIYVHNSSKVSSLNGKINRLMRWRPARKLHLYEEIKPDRIDCLDRSKSFADSEIVNGDIICFQEALSVAETQTLRTQYPRLVLDATQFYAKMRNKSQETKHPKVPKPVIDFVVLPGQSFEDALKSLQERMDILNKDLTGYKFTCSQENDSVIAYSNFDSLMTCTICLELLVDPVSFMDCMHIACGACAVEWFRHSSTCHQCRQPVRAVHYIHAVAATVEAYCQYNRLANRSDAELANLRAKYKPGQLIEINRPEKMDSDPTAEERPMSTAGCPGCNPGNELHFLCPEPILDDAGNTMFPGHARCEDCNAHLPLMPEFSLECCAVCTRFTCRELKLQCGSVSTTAPFLIQPLGTIRFPKELDTNLFETIPIKYEREILIKYAQDYDMGTQELFTVLLELHEGTGLPRASWHGVGRAPFDRDFVSSNNLVCVTCAKDLVAGALLAWGQSIGPSLSPARRLCEFGVACRQALIDEGHAQTFSHICTPTGNNHPRRLRDDTGAQEDGNRVVCDHTELGDQGRYSFSFDTEEVEFKRDGTASFLCSVVVHSELQEHGQTSTYPGSTVIRQGEAIAVYLEGNRERAHSGPIRLLLDRRNMRWVRTSRGQIPPGCRPILGGVDRSNSWEAQELYHCAAWLGGVRAPGYISRTMKHAHVAHPFDGELWKVSDDYELLCWA